MAISDPVAITVSGVTTNAAFYDSTITGSLAVDDIVILVCMPTLLAATGVRPTVTKQAGTATVGTITTVGSGVEFLNTDGYGLYVAWCRVTGAGTAQFRASYGSNRAGHGWVVIPLRGTDLTDPIPQIDEDAGQANDPDNTLTNAPPSTSWVYQFSNIRRNPAGWAPDTATSPAWIEDWDTGQANPAQGWWVAHREAGQQSALASGTNGTHNAVMIEVQEPSAAPSAQLLKPVIAGI